MLSRGTRLGPYQILAPLGAGGMGEVYRARDPRLGRDVAIKVLPASFASDSERLRRFEQEARAASSLSDPHIVAVFDVGTADGIPFFASELVEGSSLRELLHQGTVPMVTALDVAGQIALGLAAAHEKGIVHRDLKPENVLVNRSGNVKIADFGLAKRVAPGDGTGSQITTSPLSFTEAGVVLGTAAYMSPEQARGGPVDYRSDQFSFGLILYEMLAVFVGQNDQGVYGLYLQDFNPDRDTSSTRLPLGGFDGDLSTESFGISPDGTRIVLAGWEQLSSLVLADQVPGISPSNRRAP